MTVLIPPPPTFFIGTNLLLVMSAIVSGTTLGSHVCFCSDATMLILGCCRMENVDYTPSQLPYPLYVAGLPAVGYLVRGLLMQYNRDRMGKRRS